MSDHPFDRLPPRSKAPVTVRAIETWIQQAESKSGVAARRLGWLVASSVLIAAIQRKEHTDAKPRFLLKGGAYLELRLGLQTRATKDIDTLFRGDFSQCLDALDSALSQPFGEITFQRGEVEEIAVPWPEKPIRLHVSLMIRGRTWRRLVLEISPDEARAGEGVDLFPAPSLAHFGLDTPTSMAGIAMAYQVAQKIHACSADHTPDRPNDRVRDVIDLLLIQEAFYRDEKGLAAVAEACREIFLVRAQRSNTAHPRRWPPVVLAHKHWNRDYAIHASEVGFDFDLASAVKNLTAWMRRIDRHA